MASLGPHNDRTDEPAPSDEDVLPDATDLGFAQSLLVPTDGVGGAVIPISSGV